MALDVHLHGTRVASLRREGEALTQAGQRVGGLRCGIRLR